METFNFQTWVRIPYGLLIKKCSRCKQLKPYSLFCKNKCKKDGFSTYCRECNKSYHQNHYDKHRSEYVLKHKNRRLLIREWFIELKSKLKCSVCAENHPATLDFHHIDNTLKFKGLCEMVAETYSKEVILKEIEKCVVLCANCHRKHHWKEM